MSKAVEIAIRELTALGSFWRNDWSHFDGRTLRSQIGHITSYLRNNVGRDDPEDLTEYTEMLKEQEENY